MKIFPFLLVPFISYLSAESGQSLFDGKSLKGWDGNPDHWRVQDGVILGENTKEKPTKGNTFLVWKGGVLKDFDLVEALEHTRSTVETAAFNTAVF